MNIANQQQIFGLIFRVSNQLQATIDQTLKDDLLTAKQFFLMIVIQSFDENPSLNQISERFGSSRQNAKQLVNKLVRNNYVEEFQDEKDKRTLRFKLTIKAFDYWDKRDLKDMDRMNQLFKHMDETMITNLLQGLNQLMTNMEDMKNENFSDIRI